MIDSMTPRERLLSVMRGDPVDRVPLALAGFQFGSRERIAALADPLRRRVAERIFDDTHCAFEIGAQINRWLVTPPQRIRRESRELMDGCRETLSTIDTPRGELTAINRHDPRAGTGWVVKYPVETMDDIEAIASVPWELPASLAPPSLDDLPDDFSERGFVKTRISSPFVCVAGMMDYQQFLGMCATDAELICELTETCRQRELDVLKVLLSKPGIEYFWLGGSEWITPPMASPATYDMLAQEQERDLIAYIHEHSDAVVHVHCHGKTREALPKVIERGGDYTEPVEGPPDGDITLAEAKEIAAGRITLGGNVQCRVLCNEDEARVERDTRAAFEGGKERFVLRPTEGPTPRLSEREFNNYMRMVDVWEELSPIN